MTDPIRLAPQERAVLTGPDFVARRFAGGSDPQRNWMLKRPRDVRRDFVRQVIDGGADEQRWMLLQDDDTRFSFIEEVLDHQDPPDRQARWLLSQPKRVRESYVDDVIDE